MIAKMIRRLQNAMGWITGRGVVIPQKDWDTQYQAGQWDFIAKEEDRYNALVQILSDLLGKQSEDQRILLDLGCGEGWMLQQLFQGKVALTSYLGVDLSNEAIKRAEQRGHQWPVPQKWIAQDMDQYIQQELGRAEKPTVILFNESLCYLPDPLATWNRCVEWLRLNSPQGYIMCSLYSHPRTKAILSHIKRQGDFQERKVGQWTMLWDKK